MKNTNKQIEELELFFFNLYKWLKSHYQIH